MLKKKQSPISALRQAQPVHSISAKRGCQKKEIPLVHSVKPNQYTASVPKDDVNKQKQGLPLVHSVKPNQYTAPVSKEDVKQNAWAPISTLPETHPVHSTSANR